MLPVLQKLYNDPRFQGLSYADQLVVLNNVIPSNLNKDPRFQQLDNYNKGFVLSSILTAPVPALKDKVLENELRQMRSEALSKDKPMTPEEMERAARNPETATRDVGMGKARAYAFKDEALRNNVGTQWITKYIIDPVKNALGFEDLPSTYEALYGEDKAKANQFVKNLLGSTGDTTGQALGVTGSVVGTLTDWLAVAVLQAPIVKPIAAYGITKLSPKLLQMFPKVNARGLMTASEVMMPQLVDAFIDGIINIPRAETLAELNKEPTPSSQGLGEIAKQFGIGAAFDFGVGTALNYALLTPRIFRSIFRKSPALTGGLDDANLDDAITRMVNGVLPDERWNLLNPKQKAFANQQAEIYRYINNATDSPESLAMGRLHLLAQDTGSIVDTSGGKWDIYSPNKDGAFDLFNFKSYTESLDYLSDNLYLQAKKLGVKKRAGLFEADGWAWDYSQTRRVPEELTEKLRKDNIKGAPLSKRGDTIAMSQAEADFLVRNSSPEGIQTIRVDADLNEFADKIAARRIPFKEGLEVSPNPSGNSVAIVRKVAPQAEYDAAGVVAKKASMLNPNIGLEEYRRIYLLSNGYDAVQLPSGKLRMLSEFSTKVIAPDEILTAGKGIKKSIGETFFNQAYVNTTMEKMLRGRELMNNPRALSDILYKLSRNVDEKDARRFTEAFLHDSPINSKDIKIRILNKDNVAPDGRGVMVRRMVGPEGEPQIEILLPRKITSQPHEKRFVYDYMASLNKLVKELGPDVKKTVLPRTVLGASPIRWELPQGVGINPKSWVEGVVNEFGGSYRLDADGRHLVRFHGMKEAKSFENWRDVTDFVAKYTVTPEVLKEDLMLKGIRLSRNRDGIYRAVGKGLDAPVEAQSISQMMEKLNYFPEKLDVRFGPREAILTDSGVFIEEQGLNIIGDRKKVLQMLDKFEDKLAKSQAVLVGDTPQGPIFKQPDATFLVHIPEYKYGKVFDNAKDAKDYLNKFDSLEVLSEVAERKGFYLKLNSNGEFILYGYGGKMAVKDHDSLKRVFQGYPDAEAGAPSLFATTVPDADIQAKDILSMYKKTQFPESVPIRYGLPELMPEDVPAIDAWTHFKAMTSRTTKWMEDYARKVDGSFLPLFREMENGLKNANIESSHALKVLDKIFTGSNGKRVPKMRRRELFGYLGALEEGIDPDVYVKTSKMAKLSASEVEMVSDIRKYWNALGDKFGIKSQDWITNYRSRILDWHSSANKRIVNDMENAGEMLEAIFGKERVGKEIKAFFENARVSDVLSFAAKDDIMEVLTQYTMTGIKKSNLQDTWTKVDLYIKQNAKQLERTGFTARVNHYREAVMGYTKTNAERHISELGKKTAEGMYNNALIGGVLRKAGIQKDDFVKVGENAFAVLQGLQSVSAMGFKPALALRNATQIYSILAGRVGTDNVHKALKRVLEGGEDYYKYLRGMGVISDAPPIVNEIYSGEGIYAKFQELALSWFKNSDDFTRAVAFQVGDDFIEKGLRMQKAVPNISDTQLMQVMGLDLIPPDLRQTIMSMLKKNTDVDLRSAKMTLGEYWQSNTMFAYSKADSPMMFNGLIGKAFGQFGTYSAGYRAVVSDGIRYGGAAFIARFTAMNLALWGATASLGMKFNDYIPMMPMLFSGGPLFDVGVSAMKSLDPGYEGPQARAEFLDGFARMFPGSAQISYLKKAQKYSSEGNAWKAFLALTSTPTRND